MEENYIDGLLLRYSEDPLGILNALGGLYTCPKEASSDMRLGPLVGYAANSQTGKQYVGETYVNFAKVEEYPKIMSSFARQLLKKISITDYAKNENVVFVGTQMGGMSIAQFLAYHTHEYNTRYVCAEKKIVKKKTFSAREQSEIVFSRHTINTYDRAYICEDVLHNFSTTQKVIRAAEDSFGTVVGILGILNRSPLYTDNYRNNNYDIPVYSLVSKVFPQYEQDDQYVLGDIKKGNIILNPKKEWFTLERIIKGYPTTM